MSAPRFYPVEGAGGFGWFVAERVGDGSRIVSGPYTSREGAAAEAIRLIVTTDSAPEPEPVATPEQGLLAAIGDTLRSLALQADRYDAVIADLRTLVVERTGAGTGLDPARLEAIETTVRAMSERLDALETMIDDATGSHSVKV